ncbi:uncharacterized protein BDR25DRAFT_102976 [Lindgomyces ingoldianus]|uniref:Uncharacterized protein n=1 Tax=Lindgomyces ingoldianus TaxID=673940 RepID=A0ACB6R874_9PLEO|nr:uncharacterized protein BDR25DRAFT_102976 [Lindgomyces ingoldianus]KAF2475469.1 hypothetical protein BDR25DRAFT_102976 [Lindgomyces ingoldianus]
MPHRVQLVRPWRCAFASSSLDFSSSPVLSRTRVPLPFLRYHYPRFPPRPPLVPSWLPHCPVQLPETTDNLTI